MEFVTLNNGVKMPKIGFGVYEIEDLELCEQSVINAIHSGYRLIDTAQTYGNETAVGNAVKNSGISRNEIFLTTKIWISNAGYEKAKKSIEESLKKLRTDYIDLLLIHQPFNDYYGTYHAMEEAYKDGKVRAIGVSNFYPDRLIDLCQFVEIQPTVNQIESHVFYQQKAFHEIMNKYHVQHQAWGPLVRGDKNLFENELLCKIGNKYRKTAAQIALRFMMQSDIAIIPKTVHQERMQENIDLFDFSLSEEEMEEIKNLDRNESAFFSHYNPETVEFLTNLAKKEM